MQPNRNRFRLILIPVFITLCFGLLPAKAISETRDVDPLTGFNFALSCGAFSGYFSYVSGLGSETEVVEHKVVDESGNEIIQKIPGRLSWLNVTLRRGITSAIDLWDWRQQVVEGQMDLARRNCTLSVYDSVFEVVAQWDLVNTWPSRIVAPYTPEDSQLGVEEITLVLEGLTRQQ